jgi:hypothetical protein
VSAAGARPYWQAAWQRESRHTGMQRPQSMLPGRQLPSQRTVRQSGPSSTWVGKFPASPQQVVAMQSPSL